METDIGYTLTTGATYSGYKISKTNIDLEDLIAQLNAARGWNIQSSSEIAFKRLNGDGDLNFTSGDADSVLNLKQLMKDSNGDAGNWDITYDGGGGTDMLSYRNDTNAVTMTVYGGSAWDFYLDGGRGNKLNNNDLRLSSLETWTRDVEIFELTDNADMVDLSGWSGAYQVSIYGDGGDDTITGSDHADTLYGEGGNDTIDAGAGDDFVDPGDINTGKQETITLGAGYDTLFLGDIGSTDADYEEITGGLSDLETNAIETASSLPSMIFNAGMKSVFAAWTKANPVTATVLSVSFEVGGSVLGSVLTTILGGNKAAASTHNGGGSDASGVHLNDLNTTEDTIILPVTDFNAPDMLVADAAAGKATFYLDAEDGGEFMDAYIVNTDDDGDFSEFLAKVYNAENGTSRDGAWIWDNSIHTKYDVNTALLNGAWESRLVFSKLTNASNQTQVTASQGETVLYDSLDSSVAGDVDFSAMATLLDSSLSLGDSAVIMGNVVGQDVAMSDSRRYANGNDQSDTFTIAASGRDAAYYINGNDGNDLLEINQLVGVDINFDGGDGTDIISFANAHVWGDSSATTSSYALNIDLRNDTHNFVSDTAAFETDQGAGKTPDARLWSVEGIIGSSGSDRLIGNEDDNILMTNGGGDHMEGGGGDDILRGGAGWDRMYGDRHNGTDTSDDGDDYFYTGMNSDLIWGGGGSDTADFSEAGRSGWTIDLSATKAASGHWAFKTNSTTGTYVEAKVTGHQTLMSGIENVVGTAGGDTITGDGGGNYLAGIGGNDTLNGGGGTDWLVGGEGNDTLTGGADQDLFVFDVGTAYWGWSTLDTGSDTITDMSASDNDWLIFAGDGISTSDLSFVSDASGTTVHVGGRSVKIDGVHSTGLGMGETGMNNDWLGFDNQDVVIVYRTATNLTDTLSLDAASASSYYYGVNDAYRVLDGNTNSFNHTAPGDSDATLYIDLGDDALLDKIVIENRNDGDAAHQAIVNGRLAGATVQVYNDNGFVWESAALTSAVTQTVDLQDKVGDEIRIKSNDGDYLHIAELDVYGEYLV